MLRKANQKRSLDDLVIRDGEFDWRKVMVSDLQMEQALDQVEDVEDAQAARNAAAEMYHDTRGEQQEFDESAIAPTTAPAAAVSTSVQGNGDVSMTEVPGPEGPEANTPGGDDDEEEAEEQEEEEDELEAAGLGGVERHMVRTVDRDWAYFSEWRIK